LEKWERNMSVSAINYWFQHEPGAVGEG